MGRGRAKAQQRKIARALKYDGGRVDLDRLRHDLRVGDGEERHDHLDPEHEDE
ncbi:DUF3073 domain-containing protein [Actinocorallia sp. API 0066]|uniref:DUF3073 family protein n=1 Tax=Actinocorallia sp. API 0066 TaxID=2896846 RepID=UPI001E55523D|nr:DUF3073 family protein [Actinocorallia sp. API 0066]MCD0451712.1 DUF3073 domain-containing protein [Actinocorallia sp. API 0066]